VASLVMPPGTASAWLVVLPRTAGNRAAGFPFSGRGNSLGERSERRKAAPGTFHHAPVKAKPHEVTDCPAAGGAAGPRAAGR